MKYTKTELRKMSKDSIKKDSEAKAAAGVFDSPTEFRITNNTAHIRTIADLLCRMQDLLQSCQDLKDTFNYDIDVYEQAWRGIVSDMEWDLDFWNRQIDKLIKGE